MATLSTAMGRLQALFLANIALQLLDGWVTFTGVSRGFGEGNPLVASAMSSVGPIWGIAAVKVAAMALLFLVYQRREHPYVEPGLISLAFTYVMFAIVPWTLILANTSG